MTDVPEVEKTVECTNCGHPVWFIAGENDPHPCTDCGTVNSREQPDIFADGERPMTELTARSNRRQFDIERLDKELRDAGYTTGVAATSICIYGPMSVVVWGDGRCDFRGGRAVDWKLLDIIRKYVDPAVSHD